MMLNEIRGMKRKDKEKMRKPIIKELEKLFKKYGASEVSYTLRWYFLRQSAKVSRENKIEVLKKEIEEIKKGKNPDYR